MTKAKQNTMRAAAIDRFGGPEMIMLQTLPVPEVGLEEVLIRVETAGVATWDADEREGRYAGTFGVKPKFPYILGWDGAGIVAAVGQRVSHFKEGDRVYAAGIPKLESGFYAEYAAVKAEHVAHIPDKLTTEQAGVMPWDALTALSGLDEALGIKPGEALMIFGASGGIGHMAIQLAKRMGARVLAVASGEDGVMLAQRLGADTVVNGRTEDVTAAVYKFAPEGLDAALAIAGGETVEKALSAVRDGGRIAYPNGVAPTPKARLGVSLINYDGNRRPEGTSKLNRLIDSGPFEVHIAHTFPLDQAAEAHRALSTHFLGKLALRPR